MSRLLLIASVLALPGLAWAEDFPRSPLDLEVRGHNGETVGRVTQVERNEAGEIVAVEIEGAEPADAPQVDRNVVAQAPAAPTGFRQTDWQPSRRGGLESGARTRLR